MKGFAERDLAKNGIRIVATGDLTEEDVLDAVGDNALGIVTSLQYSEVHNSPENKAYTQATERPTSRTARTTCRSAASTGCN
jgi:branched-chain amino acid transport system substrate-binding protein